MSLFLLLTVGPAGVCLYVYHVVGYFNGRYDQ
jgi:hypothetical protein